MEKEIQKILKKLDKYSFILGVVNNETRPDDEEVEGKKERTNSEILMLHELGSPLNKIPARPILQYTIEHKDIQELLDELVEECIYLSLEGKNKMVDIAFEKTALRIERFIRTALRTGDHNLKKLSPQRIKEKNGGTLPLVDTGQLYKSIVCKVIKK